jgi:hypothetical protein
MSRRTLASEATKTANVRKKAGRPSAFRNEYCEQAYKLCLLGATDAKLADFFAVSEQTINAWKSAHPQFLESLKRGKEAADAEIAEALFHRAKGYSHAEDDIRTVTVGGSGGSQVVITPTLKRYPPDTHAASLWLRNRQPELWRDKVEVEHFSLGALHLDAVRAVRERRLAPQIVEEVRSEPPLLQRSTEDGEGASRE